MPAMRARDRCRGRDATAGPRCTRSSRASIPSTAARLAAHTTRSASSARSRCTRSTGRPLSSCRARAKPAARRHRRDRASRSCRATARALHRDDRRRASTRCSRPGSSRSSRRCARATRSTARLPSMRCVGYRQAWAFSTARSTATACARRHRRDAPAREAPAHVAARDAGARRSTRMRNSRRCRALGATGPPRLTARCCRAIIRLSIAHRTLPRPRPCARTLYDKLLDSHVVRTEADGTALLYIDRHLVHEVTSPQAYEGLRLAGRKPWRVGVDRRHRRPQHADQGLGRGHPRSDLAHAGRDARRQHPRDRREGVLPVPRPAPGHRARDRPRDRARRCPGMTVVCGDSHTSTHGAFAALAFGIGTSEVEHVLATQCLLTQEARRRCWSASTAGSRRGVTAKDIVLAVIGQIGTAGGTGHAIEFARRGDPRAVDGRADDGLQHGDRGGRARRHGRASTTRRSTTCAAGRSRRAASCGTARSRTGARCVSDEGATFDTTHVFDAARDPAAGHVGHVAGDGRADRRPRARSRPASATRRGATASSARSRTWGSTPNTPITDIAIDKVFIGSCTNSRIEDLRAAAAVARGRHVASNVKLAMVVPGSGLVKAQAEREGLDTRVPRRGLRMARAGLLDVPRDERRPARAGRALRVDVEPQFRRPAGRRRPHASRQPGDGRRAAAIAGHFVDVRRAVVAEVARSPATPHRAADRDGTVSRPHRARRAARPRERRHRRDHPEAVPEVDQALGLRPEPVRRVALPRPRRAGHGQRAAAAQSGFRAERAALPGRDRSCSRAATSAAAARASTRRGRSPTTASAR